MTGPEPRRPAAPAPAHAPEAAFTAWRRPDRAAAGGRGATPSARIGEGRPVDTPPLAPDGAAPATRPAGAGAAARGGAGHAALAESGAPARERPGHPATGPGHADVGDAARVRGRGASPHPPSGSPDPAPADAGVVAVRVRARNVSPTVPTVPPGPAPDATLRLRRSEAAPLHVGATLRAMRRGGGDPTWRDGADGSLWKAWRTPEGPVTVHLADAPAAGGDAESPSPSRPFDDRAPAAGGTAAPAPGTAQPRRPARQRPDLLARAWGPGARWLLARLPRILGADDDPSGFATHHEVVARAAHDHPDLRIPATGMVVEALVPTIIEQKVTGREAFAAYRTLVRRFGEAAPGPAGLMVAPSAAGWARIPSWEWARAGVDGKRADTVMRAMRVAGRLEECAHLSVAQAHARLESVPGIGRWTAAEVAHVALGDADAVSFGDYHVAADIGWALTGTPVDDDALADLLEPYRPHRYRVQRLLEMAGAMRPRRGPRFRLPTHLPRTF